MCCQVRCERTIPQAQHAGEALLSASAQRELHIPSMHPDVQGLHRGVTGQRLMVETNSQEVRGPYMSLYMFVLFLRLYITCSLPEPNTDMAKNICTVIFSASGLGFGSWDRCHIYKIKITVCFPFKFPNRHHISLTLSCPKTGNKRLLLWRTHACVLSLI